MSRKAYREFSFPNRRAPRVANSQVAAELAYFFTRRCRSTESFGELYINEREDRLLMPFPQRCLRQAPVFRSVACFAHSGLLSKAVIHLVAVCRQ